MSVIGNYRKRNDGGIEMSAREIDNGVCYRRRGANGAATEVKKPLREQSNQPAQQWQKGGIGEVPEKVRSRF